MNEKKNANNGAVTLWNVSCNLSRNVLATLWRDNVVVVEICESFRYLGRYFDFNISNNQHMSELSSLV